LPTIVFYISGHGFGHASRDIEVINAILAVRSDVRVVARTTAPEWLFNRTIRESARFSWFATEVDTGVVQIDSLHLDEAATLARAREFLRTFADRVHAEAVFLHAQRAALVVADIPPLGVAAARRAGVPAVALGNFSWDWIYAAYDGGQDIARALGDVYRDADLALRLPMHGGFAAFPQVVDVPLVARRSSRAADETKRVLNLPRDARIVLVSFGGYGVQHIREDALARLDEYVMVGTAAHPLDEDAMYDAGLRYEDLVHAVDVVVTKPGYGIISECIANDTAMLYTSRGHFAEYDVLVREMPRFLRAHYINHADLFAGAWRAHLAHVLTLPAAPERPRVDGADVVSGYLLDMIGE
jgi:L-arabinokinase